MRPIFHNFDVIWKNYDQIVWSSVSMWDQDGNSVFTSKKDVKFKNTNKILLQLMVEMKAIAWF